MSFSFGDSASCVALAAAEAANSIRGSKRKFLGADMCDLICAYSRHMHRIVYSLGNAWRRGVTVASAWSRFKSRYGNLRHLPSKALVWE